MGFQAYKKLRNPCQSWVLIPHLLWGRMLCRKKKVHKIQVFVWISYFFVIAVTLQASCRYFIQVDLFLRHRWRISVTLLNSPSAIVTLRHRICFSSLPKPLLARHLPHYRPLFAPHFQPFTQSWRVSFSRLLTSRSSGSSRAPIPVPHTIALGDGGFCFSSEVNSDLYICITAVKNSNICNYCHIELSSHFFSL